MLITNATLPYWKDTPRLLTDYALYVENGVIRAIGPTETFIWIYRDAPRLNAQNQWVLPGNICAHTHCHHSLLKGLIPDADFPLAEKHLSRIVDHDALYLSALACAMNAIQHGTTSLFNTHHSVACTNGSLDVIARAMNEAGIRAVLTYETEENTPHYAEAQAENQRFIQTLGHYGRIASGANLPPYNVYNPRAYITRYGNLNGLEKHLDTATIGTDDGRYDMWEEWRTLHMLLRHPLNMSPEAILDLCLSHNAHLLMQAFPHHQFGDLTEGTTADIIFVDYQPTVAVTLENIAWHVLYGIGSWMVDTTIIGGEVIMRHGELLTLDEAHIRKEARTQSQKIWERYNTLQG